MFHNTCLNLFNICSLFFGGIIIYSTFLEFSSIICFVSTASSAIFLVKNPPVASAALSITFLEAVFEVFIPVSNNCLPYLLDNFFKDKKGLYPLTYFFVPGSI